MDFPRKLQIEWRPNDFEEFGAVCTARSSQTGDIFAFGSRREIWEMLQALSYHCPAGSPGVWVRQ